MKIVVVLVALAGVLPLSLLLRSSRRIAEWAWIAIGFLPFLLPAVQQVDIALISGEGWIGYVHGAEMTVIDFLVIALLIALPRTRKVLSFHVPLALYMFALVLSLTQAAEPVAAFFNVVQFARIYLLAVVVARGCAEEGVPLLLMKGLALGLALQLIVVAYQLASGAYVQPPGTFAHQNTLGMVIHFIALPHFAMFLAGARGLQFVVVPPMSLLIAALTASRATIVLCLAGLGLTYFLSLFRGVSKRKITTGALGFLVVLLVVPIALSSFERRIAATPLSENAYDERAAFNRAAAMIVDGNPWGVGANHYVYVAKNFGYSIKAGVIDVDGNLNNIVHNAYLLAAVETGYLGLFAFVVLLFYPLVTAFRYSLSAPTLVAGDLLMGIAAALTIVSLHSSYEYILFGQDVQYVFAITFGIVAGVASRVAMRKPATVGPQPLLRDGAVI
ncbi:O-antigen ligase family protein [Hyphomicrobium sp.]|uniref:O-antigen ligase family protein n=1 Tax=Hyphomicrobium sp. TaxID=82 RepID=UPI002E319A38|nr:O-antigen ligase family protein [Hyphomicrobium sp.]HEX2842500.1 O-antigen ligase family protein [Hyphomicrobium sp.]